MGGLARWILGLSMVWLMAGCASSGGCCDEAEAAVGVVLDAFHDAAAHADGKTYFGLLTDDAVFLGTDPGERWPRQAFEEWAQQYFERESAWTYVSVERHVVVEPGGKAAWFDEVVRNASYGDLRGTGVLRRTSEGWRIAQYNLTFVVPNGIAGEVVEMIRAATGP